ncbi:hypothetical protein [Bacillus velezensis]|nr:hypothetical protein [Bacillus velezensis]
MGEGGEKEWVYEEDEVVMREDGGKRVVERGEVDEGVVMVEEIRGD